MPTKKTTTAKPKAAAKTKALAPVEAVPDGLAKRDITIEQWNVLKNVIWPDCQSKATMLMAIDYCRSRGLDPLKRPIHIVSVWDSKTNSMRETIWPGISELLTTASRTGEFAGKDQPIFGPDVELKLGGVTVTVPEYCIQTLYRLVDGQRVAFVSDPLYYAETYANKKGGAPNAMWTKRPHGQLAKCALAAALRIAFPEEIGGDYAAEEMDGQTVTPPAMVEQAPAMDAPQLAAPQAAPTDDDVVDVDPEPESPPPSQNADAPEPTPEPELVTPAATQKNAQQDIEDWLD